MPRLRTGRPYKWSFISCSGCPPEHPEQLGGHSAEVYSPVGVEVDKYGNLYIADEDNYRIRKVVDTSNHSTYVKTVKIQNNIEVYPNPANEYLTIKGSSAEHITILNAMGQVLMEQKNYGSNKTIVNVGSLSSGVYFVKIRDVHGAEMMKRFIKE